MKLIQTTARFLFAATLLLSLGACNRDDDLFVKKEYSRLDIPLTGAQNFPPSPTSALGAMNIHYNKATKLLSYTIRWSGLSGPVATVPIPGMSIHGMAPAGYPANPIQIFSLSGITMCATVSNTSCGTYSGRLFVDGVLITEDNLLNGVYYVSIRTAAFPMGELRAQIRF
ncbi:MAG: CHRD domain-containing protein [Bacteroidetes bacterium]|nr:CHRD domain-containing protein [Bacteroidota bacterium]